MLPTSEIIQTVFLALKVAKEHEIRELFRVEHKGAMTTPFNNHQDLPVLSRLKDVFAEKNHCCELQNTAQVQDALNRVNYDFALFTLQHLEQRSNNQWLLDIQIEPTEQTSLTELLAPNVMFTLIISKLTINSLYQAVMEQLLQISNSHIEEHFKYKGFNRFSKQHNIMLIAELSLSLRHQAYIDNNKDFIKNFNTSSYDTDKTRVPCLAEGSLSEKLKSTLSCYPELTGFLPDIITTKKTATNKL